MAEVINLINKTVGDTISQKLGIYQKNGKEEFDQVLFDAQIKKLEENKSDPFKSLKEKDQELVKKNAEKSKNFEKSIKLQNNANKPKASNQLTRENMLRIMIEKSKPSSLDKKDSEADSAQMMVAIANMDSQQQFTDAVKNFINSSQLISAMNLDGKEVEAYAPIKPEDKEYYEGNPEERPIIMGTVVNSSKEAGQFLIHLKIEGNTEPIKVPFKDLKPVLTHSLSKKQNLTHSLSDIKEMAQLRKLKETAVEIFTPLEDHLLEYKDYIDPNKRKTITGEIIDFATEEGKHYLKVKNGNNIHVVEPENIKNILDSKKKNPLEEMLTQTQWFNARNLKDQIVEAFEPLNDEKTNVNNRATFQGKVLDILKEGRNVFLNIEQGDKVVKVNFNDIK